MAETGAEADAFDATSSALDAVISSTITFERQEINNHIHTPSNHPDATSWVSSWFPLAALQRLESRYHFGNYVIDRDNDQKFFEPMSLYVRVGMHLLYYGSYQQRVLQWRSTEQLLERQTIKMGKFYDSRESVSEIAPFINNFRLWSSLDELKEPDPRKYRTFNQFFARELREGARPIAEPNSDLVYSSPADCRLTAYQTIDLATTYWIKGHDFSIASLLGSNEVAQCFAGGSILIARLAPQDYHRWHSPISGSVKRVWDIPGCYYTVNPQAINEAGTLDVFCQNRRSVMTMEHSATGATFAIVAVGAMLVGSIKYAPGMDVAGKLLKRGECLGYFQFGGSTVIVLFQKGEVSLDEDLTKNSTQFACETLMKVGWKVGEKKVSQDIDG